MVGVHVDVFNGSIHREIAVQVLDILWLVLYYSLTDWPIDRNPVYDTSRFSFNIHIYTLAVHVCVIPLSIVVCLSGGL